MLIIVVVVLAAIFIFQTSQPQFAGEKQLKEWQAAMRADTVGGQTAEETLQMFLAALRAGDVELASRFFLLDEEGNRERWTKELNEAKKLGRTEKIVAFLSTAVPAVEEITSEGDFKFKFNDEGNTGFLDMELNTYSGVWKIESF